MSMKKSKEKRSLKEWFKSLSKPKKALLIAGCVILLLLILLVAYVVSKFSKLDTQDIDEDDIYISENQTGKKDDDDDDDIGVNLGTGYFNFVLFGGDSRTGEVEGAVNTDAIIIISLNNETKKVKLISVYRDTLLDNTTGYITKVNSAYSSGGPARAMSSLNKNLDLDITKYVTVDFGVVADVIDQLGGIYVNISEAEMNAMNKYIKETAKAAGKEAVLITETGYQHVDGVQATTYARIRKGVGDDYQRTERQREVIEKVVQKVIHSDWTTIDGIIDDVLPRISTNFSFAEILKYAMNFASYDITDSEGFPFDKSSATISGRGSCVFATSLYSNVVELHKLLFELEDYEPSSTVSSISYTIDKFVASNRYTQNVTSVTPSEDTETPSVDSNTSSTDPETPSTDPETPSADPSTNPETPSVDSNTPSTDPETPSTDPSTNPETPNTESNTPSTDAGQAQGSSNLNNWYDWSSR